MSSKTRSKQLVLHVGAPKTGSTYLQRRLQANRAPLRAAGAAYPALKATPRMAGNAKFLPMVLAGAAQPLFRFNYPDIDVPGTDPHEVIGEMLAPFEAGARTVILSAENLRSAQAAEFCALLPVDVRSRVVLIVRRQDDWVDSVYNQMVKNRLTKRPPADFLADCRATGFAPLETPDWHAIYRAWTAAAGDCRVIVYDAEKAALFERFLAAAELNPGDAPNTIERQNASLSAFECAYLIGLDAALPFEDFLLRRRCAARVAGDRPAARFFSTAQRQQMIEEFALSNAALLDAIGRRDLIELLTAPAPARPHDDLGAIYASPDYAAFVSKVETAAAH